MSMQIKSSADIAAIFSTFHDGGIEQYIFNGSSLEIQVHIQYLAERIVPSFRSFKVTLVGLKNISLETWPDDHKAKHEIIKDLDLIFTGDLDILSGELKENFIQVDLNQSKTGMGYCGGVLFFQASSAIVIDEAGKEYSIKELENLASGYWEEWKQRKKT